jgi:hypothetical protein
MISLALYTGERVRKLRFLMTDNRPSLRLAGNTAKPRSFGQNIHAARL